MSSCHPVKIYSCIYIGISVYMIYLRYVSTYHVNQTSCVSLQVLLRRRGGRPQVDRLDRGDNAQGCAKKGYVELWI